MRRDVLNGAVAAELLGLIEQPLLVLRASGTSENSWCVTVLICSGIGTLLCSSA
jgi:hypothetical protein